MNREAGYAAVWLLLTDPDGEDLSFRDVSLVWRAVHAFADRAETGEPLNEQEYQQITHAPKRGS